VVGANQRAQIRMSDAEVTEFVQHSRTTTLATNGPSGMPHLVAMWYAVLDGEIWFETKAKSQKVQNLRRDDRVTCMIEDGRTYDVLRGVAIEGRAVISSEPEDILRVGISVWERYYGPYTEDQRPMVDAMMNKRVVVRVIPTRTRSWDHRKLGLPVMLLGGSTAAHLDQDGL
jgi:PPOX class probable F420-dependent enzyme